MYPNILYLFINYKYVQLYSYVHYKTQKQKIFLNEIKFLKFWHFFPYSSGSSWTSPNLGSYTAPRRSLMIQYSQIQVSIGMWWAQGFVDHQMNMELTSEVFLEDVNTCMVHTHSLIFQDLVLRPSPAWNFSWIFQVELTTASLGFLYPYADI